MADDARHYEFVVSIIVSFRATLNDTKKLTSTKSNNCRLFRLYPMATRQKLKHRLFKQGLMEVKQGWSYWNNISILTFYHQPRTNFRSGSILITKAKISQNQTRGGWWRRDTTSKMTTFRKIGQPSYWKLYPYRLD